MSYSYTTLAGLKSIAKKLQREQQIPYHSALELTARLGGFECYKHAQRQLIVPPSAKFVVPIKQNWWGYQSEDGGSAKVEVELLHPLAELVRPHHLTGYLGSSKIRADGAVERSGMQRDADETQWYISRIARALQFMDATGLKPSSALKCYPDNQWDNRPPLADHDHCWFDPEARVHLLSTEPYPDRAERRYAGQPEWEARHGWKACFVEWGSIYGNGTQLFLCCPEAYLETLKKKAARLEASPPAILEEDVKVERWEPHQPLVLEGVG